MHLTPEQLAKIHQKDAEQPDALLRDPLTDYYEGYFHVTLNTRGEAPVLGYMAGHSGAAAGSADAPHVDLTALGKRVKESWDRNPDVYPGIENIAFQVMPEHVHGLVRLKPGNKQHLGRIVYGFMVGCTHGYWDTLGIDWRSMTYVKGERSPEWFDRDHTRSLRGPSLFVRGYNDVEALTPEEVEAKIAYIRSNPERRIIKGERRDVFGIRRKMRSASWTVGRAMAAIDADPRLRLSQRLREEKASLQERLNILAPDAGQALWHESQEPAPDTAIGIDCVGEKALLYAKKKVSLICHRADASLFEQQAAATLKMAREGAVVVSAFISPREREIKQQLLLEQWPVIEIADNGFNERYKPGGKAFYACAEGRLVQMTPWHYVYERDKTISRLECLVMNELVRLISGCDDHWWRAMSVER